jgi:CRP-like cAMP-binding protein
MSDPAVAADAALSSTVAFLNEVPVFAGIRAEELAELARVFRRREPGVGEILWRQGDEANAMFLVVDGRLSVSIHLPGDRDVEIGRAERGDVLGEVPLLDGGRHSGTVRVAEAASLLALSRADFAALVSRSHPTSFTLKRRLAGVVSERLRVQLAALASSMGGGAPPAPGSGGSPPAAELEFRGPPDPGYLRRLGTFHAFDAMALWSFLTAGRFALCPPGRTVVAEGSQPRACYLTINGAVEKVIVRGGRRIRVGLAGPGVAFGYEGLIDGGPSAVTATTRERTLLLVLPQEAFERLFNGEDSGSHAFLDVIHRDLTAALRQALRPHARLAISV